MYVVVMYVVMHVVTSCCHVAMNVVMLWWYVRRRGGGAWWVHGAWLRTLWNAGGWLLRLLDSALLRNCADVIN